MKTLAAIFVFAVSIFGVGAMQQSRTGSLVRIEPAVSSSAAQEKSDDDDDDEDDEEDVRVSARRI